MNVPSRIEENKKILGQFTFQGFNKLEVPGGFEPPYTVLQTAD